MSNTELGHSKTRYLLGNLPQRHRLHPSSIPCIDKQEAKTLGTPSGTWRKIVRIPLKWPGHRILFKCCSSVQNVLCPCNGACSQLTDECGNDVVGTPYTLEMTYDGTVSGGLVQGDMTYTRFVMDLYACVPYGNYELVVEINSTNGETDGVPNEMNPFFWEIEYGGDEVCAKK